MKRQRRTLSRTAKEILLHLQFKGFMRPEWFICNREHRAMDTLCHNGLATWVPEFSSYRVTDKGRSVKGWSFYK